MRINRLGLTMKFSISVALLITVAMLGSATLIISYQKESLRQNIFESWIEMTKNLAHDAVNPMLVFDPLRLDELVRTVTGSTARTFAMITYGDGPCSARVWTERKPLNCCRDFQKAAMWSGNIPTAAVS